MKRRTFLRHATHAAAVPGLLGTLGFSYGQNWSSLLKYAQDTDRVLVIIYLEGGNDGLNTVVPLDRMGQLHKVRPHVVLPEDRLLNLNNTEVALHPSLSNFELLFNEGKLGIIQSVGYPEQNFSHFRSTDIWMSGSGSQELVNSGWSGRYLNQQFPGYPQSFPSEDFTDPLAIEIGHGASLLFQGPEAAMGMVVSNPESFYDLVDNVEEPAPDTPAGDKLKYVRLIARQSETYGEVVKQAAERVTQQREYPDNNNLAQQLKIVARLIAGGLRTPMYMVRIGGFDTHDNQVVEGDHTVGEHANLLNALDRAVHAFQRDLEFLNIDDRVVGMTFSEFGRRIVSNASNGTDHGSAAPMFVFGKNVIGGVLGANPSVDFNATYGDNLELQYDFRQIYGSLLEQWLGSDNSARAQVLLEEFETVPLIGDSFITTLDRDENLKVFPNPVTGPTQVEFNTSGGPMEVELWDMQGKRLQRIYSGTPSSGFARVSWNPGPLQAGAYIIVVNGLEKRIAKRVLVAN